MAKLTLIKVGVRVVVYLSLLALFSYFYLVEQMSDYFKGRTTLTSRTEEVEALEAPTAIICMSAPSIKKSVALQLNLNSTTQIFFEDIPNATFREVIEKTSFKLNQDYEIFVTRKPIDEKDFHKISLGELKVDERKLLIDSIFTWEHGTCTKIQPTFSESKAELLRYIIKMNSSLRHEDTPKEYVFYFTSKDSWQGILDGTWPQFHPAKVKVIPNSQQWYMAKAIEFQRDDGFEDSEKCWLSEFDHFNCPKKCQFVNYTSTLPFCRKSEEIDCIFSELDTKNLWGKCHKKKKGFYYEGDLVKSETFRQENLTYLSLMFVEMSKQIKEEVDVITMSDLIGSVGGSLGMFFGFSISAYILFLLDRCIKTKWQSM